MTETHKRKGMSIHRGDAPGMNAAIRAGMNYPSEWVRRSWTRDAVPFRIRPIRASDETLDRQFILGLSAESRYLRMMHTMREPSAEMPYRFVHVDYDHDMAFAALVGDWPDQQIIGIARYAHDRTGLDCEFAVAVADLWQRRGVGTALMRILLEYAHVHGVGSVHGEIIADNARMLELARWLGMKLTGHPRSAGLIEATGKI
jgi:acetyltransferase